MNGSQFLAHVGPLGHHEIWIILPMALLGVAIMVVMARPKRPPLDEADRDEPEAGDSADTGADVPESTETPTPRR